MIRAVTRPSSAKCTLSKYISYLLSEPKSVSCLRVSEVLGMSHDSVNRFLNRETYSGKDLFNEASQILNLSGGALSVDDTVLDKPYANYIAYIGHFWSGKHHKTVKGINLITLFYTDKNGHGAPVNFRVYDKSEGKTKNDYFLEMIKEVIEWGLSPAFVSGDTWYSCTNNLKTVKSHGCAGFFAIEKNRTVSEKKGTWVQIQSIDIPRNGKVVWLKDYGYVRVFRTFLKEQKRHYIMTLPESQNSDDMEGMLEKLTFEDFEQAHDDHWKIEQYHRAIKQVCHAEHFQVRGKAAVKNHIFAAICGFVELQAMTISGTLKNCYQLQRQLFNDVIESFVSVFSPSIQRLDPEFKASVNA